MKFLFIIFLLSTSSFAEEWDVTSGIVRRNWSLSVSGNHLAWFTNKMACESWAQLFYRDRETNCVLK